MVKRFGEKTTLYIGQFFGGVGMFVAGIARNSFQFFASIPIIRSGISRCRQRKA